MLQVNNRLSAIVIKFVKNLCLSIHHFLILKDLLEGNHFVCSFDAGLKASSVKDCWRILEYAK